LCLKLYFLTRREKPGGPLKELRGPQEGRGHTVEKHCFRITLNLVKLDYCGARAALKMRLASKVVKGDSKINPCLNP